MNFFFKFANLSASSKMNLRRMSRITHFLLPGSLLSLFFYTKLYFKRVLSLKSVTYFYYKYDGEFWFILALKIFKIGLPTSVPKSEILNSLWFMCMLDFLFCDILNSLGSYGFLFRGVFALYKIDIFKLFVEKSLATRKCNIFSLFNEKVSVI